MRHADRSAPIELYPRLLNREAHLDALHRIDATARSLSEPDHAQRAERARYGAALGQGKLPRAFARQMMRVARDKESFSDWLDVVGDRCATAEVATRLTPRDRRACRAQGSALAGADHVRRNRDARVRNGVLGRSGHVVARSLRQQGQCRRGARRTDVGSGEGTAARPVCARRIPDRSASSCDRRRGNEGKAFVGGVAVQVEHRFRISRSSAAGPRIRTAREYERNILVVIPGNNRG